MYACIHIPKAEKPAHNTLVALAAMFSPRVEVAGQGTVVVATGGLQRLMGGPNQIASEMARRGAERGLMGNIAMAANPDTAVLAARHLRGVTLIPPGEERERLASLPVSVLPVEPETVEVLERWGIRTLGEFCALPESGVMERLGAQGLAVLKLARGQRTRPLRAQAEETSYEERLEPDHPVALLEPLLFLISRLLNCLCGRLKSQSMAAGEIRLTLELEDRSEHTRILQLPFATRDAKALLKLLQLDLEAHPARDAILAMRMALKPVEPRIVQNELYAPPAPEPEKLELTLGKLRGLVGEGNAGSPELIDTHRPDAWRMRSTPPGAQTLVYEEKAARAPRLGFRYFRPARAARVEVRDAAPWRVTAAAVAGRVMEASGPWRGSGSWWSQERWAREEWDVELDGGGLYRLYSSGGRWFVEGSYD